MELSVVVCAHNPRMDFLSQTLDALREQTLEKDRWELLLIDNASDEPLAGRCDLSWHPNARHIREMELGVPPARLRGAREAKTELLVFVDDDNLLISTYLESALKLATENKWLGVFGAATIMPRYEKEPDPALQWWCGSLALRNEGKDLYSNFPTMDQIKVVGAGMCIRRFLAFSLDERMKDRPNWPAFGRQGKSLMSGADIQFPLEASDRGLGYGIFACLSLTHLIPAKRVQREYLLRINESIIYSNSLLSHLRNQELGIPARSIAREAASFLGYAWRILRSPSAHRAFWWGSARAQWRALRDFRRVARTSASAE